MHKVISLRGSMKKHFAKYLVAFLSLIAMPGSVQAAGKIAVGSDGRIAYQHHLGNGIFLGTDLHYTSIGRVDDGINMYWDQMASLWLVTLAYSLEYKAFRVDNTLKYLGVEDFDWEEAPGTVGYSLQAGYRFSLLERLDFLPILDLVNYRFQWHTEDWPARDPKHLLILKLGIILKFEYRF
jgi:hypothetical protein